MTDVKRSSGRLMILALVAALGMGPFALYPQPAKVQGEEVINWAAEKAKKAYEEYKKMREAQSEQKKAEERLKSQKEFEAD